MEQTVMARTLTQALDLCAGLMGCGAEANRVEDTMRRIAAAYGVGRCEAFVITSSIYATWELEGGLTITETRRVQDTGTDLTLVEQYNGLSRQVCREKPAPEQIEGLLRELRASVPSRLDRTWAVRCLCAMLAAGSFAVFFGGTAADALLSGMAALVTHLITPLLARLLPSSLIQTFINSFVTATVCMAICNINPSINLDKVMIGTVMLLTPGIASTTSLRDLMAGDTVTGLLRVCNVLLTGGSMALGYVIAMELLGGVL